MSEETDILDGLSLDHMVVTDDPFKDESPADKAAREATEAAEAAAAKAKELENETPEQKIERETKEAAEKEAADIAAKLEAEKNETPEQKLAREAAEKEANEKDPTKILLGKISAKYKDGDKFNENGDLLDKEGKVLVTADVLEKEFADDLTGNDTDKETGIAKIQSSLQFAPTDNDGNPITYENSITGITQMTQDYANIIARQAINNTIAKHPEVVDLYRHLENKGTLDNYTPVKDWSKTEFTNKDVDVHKDIIKADLKAKGNSDDQLEVLASAIIGSSDSYEAAKKAQESLIERRRNEEATNVIAQKEAIAAEKIKVKAYWDGIHNTITSPIKTKIGEVSIPKEKQQKFLDYISKPVTDQGYTQSEVDESNLTTEDTLLLRYWLFSGFKLDDLVKQKVNEDKVKKIKDLLANSSIGGGNHTPTNFDPLNDDFLSLDNFAISNK